jgi:hypothetical protein
MASHNAHFVHGGIRALEIILEKASPAEKVMTVGGAVVGLAAVGAVGAVAGAAVSIGWLGIGALTGAFAGATVAKATGAS